MSLVDMIQEDDDSHSLSSSTNSDDDTDESYCHTHRSCSRYASCNRNTHQHSSIDSTTPINLSNNSKPVKDEIRSVENEPGHRKKFDGIKWRRICSNIDCSTYLNGGIFFKKWLCRKHYLLHSATHPSVQTNKSIPKKTKTIIPTDKTSGQSNKQINRRKRGDIMINSDGIRQKFNGKIWRPVCNYCNCDSFIVAHGYCHRHDMEIRKKKLEILSSLDDIPQLNSISKSQITRPIPSTTEKPNKGDIQLVRQQWNGTKWYSLCNYYTQDCTRRSNGIKYANLCDIHYKEYLENQNDQNLIDKTDQILSSPIIKRKKSINNDSIHFSNNIDEENATPYHCESRNDRIKQIEQYIQTDVTYPLESNDLRQGCFLIDDDQDDQYQSESSQLMVYVKKEEENYSINKRKLAIDVNSLPINCKLEITKLEF